MSFPGIPGQEPLGQGGGEPEAIHAATRIPSFAVDCRAVLPFGSQIADRLDVIDDVPIHNQGREEIHEIRKMIYTTNAIESINARYRRAVRARGHFPNEQAALKCLYLVTRSLDPTGGDRARWVIR